MDSVMIVIALGIGYGAAIALTFAWASVFAPRTRDGRLTARWLLVTILGEPSYWAMIAVGGAVVTSLLYHRLLS